MISKLHLSRLHLESKKNNSTRARWTLTAACSPSLDSDLELFRLSHPWQKVFTCSWTSIRPEFFDEYEREDLTIFFKYKTRRLSQTLVKIRHGADLRFVFFIIHCSMGSYGQLRFRGFQDGLFNGLILL